MQFEYDPERLIEEVKKRPGIWDFEDAEYRAKNIRSQLWKEIVNELMQSDVKITKSEMRELELQLQKKWKSIRDSYQKYVQHPNRTRKPYIYSKQLQFLFKNIVPQTHAQADGGASSESDDAGKRSKKKMWKHKKKFKLAKEAEQSSDEDNDNTNDNDTGSFGHQDESRDYDNDESSYSEVPIKNRKVVKPDEFVFANVDVQPKNETEDPDKLFLLSLLPHLKAVPESARLNAKMNLMEVLRNASYSVNADKLF